MMTVRRLAWAVWFGLVIIIAVAAVVAVIVSASTTAKIRESQVNSREVLHRIDDCTTPGRKCFDGSQQRQANVVAALNQGAAAASAAAAACASQLAVKDYVAIKRCVDRTLASKRP